MSDFENSSGAMGNSRIYHFCKHHRWLIMLTLRENFLDWFHKNRRQESISVTGLGFLFVLCYLSTRNHFVWFRFVACFGLSSFRRLADKQGNDGAWCSVFTLWIFHEGGGVAWVLPPKSLSLKPLCIPSRGRWKHPGIICLSWKLRHFSSWTKRLAPRPSAAHPGAWWSDQGMRSQHLHGNDSHFVGVPPRFSASFPSHARKAHIKIWQSLFNNVVKPSRRTHAIKTQNALCFSSKELQHCPTVDVFCAGDCLSFVLFFSQGTVFFCITRLRRAQGRRWSLARVLGPTRALRQASEKGVSRQAREHRNPGSNGCCGTTLWGACMSSTHPEKMSVVLYYALRLMQP